jgi:hypothetical protein
MHVSCECMLRRYEGSQYWKQRPEQALDFQDPTCLETSSNAGDGRPRFDLSPGSLNSVCHERRTLIQLRPAEAMGSASVGDILPT